jgi:hypothetical protein
MDSRRRETDIDDAERPREALWLATLLQEEGHDVSPATAERLLLLHRTYLEAPPPDDPVVEPDIEPETDPGPLSSEFAADDRIGLERRAPDRGR